MAKKKEELEMNNDIEVSALMVPDNNVEKPSLYKYEIGDEVYVMENNAVKSFTIGKRVIITRSTIDNVSITDVFYDENNWDSPKAQYSETQLFPSKKALLNSL